MDRQSLLEKQQAVSERFNQIDARRNQDLEELHRLQGEYRLLEKLINNLQVEEKNGQQPGRTKKSANGSERAPRSSST